MAATLLALTACGTDATDRPPPTDRDDIVRALADRAVPAADPDRVADLVGDADVVGVGELSHSAHEAFTFRQDRSYGLYATDGAGPDVSVTRAFDLVVHLRHVTPGRLGPGAG